MAETIKSVLLVDYDSLQRSLAGAAGETGIADRATAWTTALETGELGPNGVRRRLMVKRCYASPNLRGKQRDAMLVAGFELVDIAEGRNAADLHMAMDIVETMANPEEYQQFIIFSAGAAVTPLLKRLKAAQRTALIFADANTPPADKALADAVIESAEFARVLRNGPSPAAGAAPAAPTPVSDRVEIEAFARRIHAATNIPLFSPKTFAELFRHLTAEVAANGYHFQTTAKNVAERITTAGRNVTRRQVVFIVKGLALKGHVFSTNDTSERLAEVFREQALYLINNAGITLDKRQESLLNAWFISRPSPAPIAAPPASVAPAPVASAPMPPPAPAPVVTAPVEAPAPLPAAPVAAAPVIVPAPPPAPPPIVVEAEPPPAEEAAPAALPPVAAAPAPPTSSEMTAAARAKITETIEREVAKAIIRPPAAEKPKPRPAVTPTRSPPVRPVELPRTATKTTPFPSAREEAKAVIAARIAGAAKMKPAGMRTTALPAKPAPKAPPRPAEPPPPPFLMDDEEFELEAPVSNPDALENSILAAIAEAVDVLVEDSSEEQRPRAERQPPPPEQPARRPANNVARPAQTKAPPPPPPPSQPQVDEDEESDDIGDQIQRIIASYNRSRTE